uniref:Large T antigen n=1 Tax=Panthera leo polyomavirus 1 TaxID=2170405 RepID=A0A2S1CJM6_9POLY|nr:713T protein [Panthera leo polyomavirus 1]
MDHILTREESKRLMELLNLPMTEYGNFPLMRRAFLKACKILHPDKGGNAEQAQELISLYRKLEESLPSLNPQESFTTDQVSVSSDTMGFYLKDWKACIKGNPLCMCLFCLLKESHSRKNKNRRPKIPPYGTPQWEAWWRDFNKDFDLSCDESMEDSDEGEPQPSTSQQQRRKRESPDDSTPGSQATPPKKPAQQEEKEIPEDLVEFLSKAILSNKTITSFLIYTTLEKSTLLYTRLLSRFKCTFISRHKLNCDGFVFLITPAKHRVSAINNFCINFCSVSFLKVCGVNKEVPLYQKLCETPYVLLTENIKGGLDAELFDIPEEAQRNVSWKMIADFASKTQCEDLYLLLGLYKEFASSVETCKKCDEKIIPDHYEHHKDHYSNACLFLDCKNQKAICQQAIDGVIASRRVETAQLSRKDQLSQRFEKLFEKMEVLFGARSNVDMTVYMAGVAWFDCLFPNQDIKDMIMEYLECIVDNIPKRRYWLFIGPVNTGKTTLAAALLDLCGGKALNINMPFDKINFELGVAIDQFSIVFEDVKGSRSENKDLPTGQGITNLDNLRDYLDGAVKVNLEKKHMNKKTQIFPPGIVTCNEYFIPLTLRVRFCRKIKFCFLRSQYFALKKTHQLSRYRVLQNGICLLLLLIYYCETEEFVEKLQSKVVYWKQRIDEEVGDSMFLKMKERCLAGQNILEDEEGANSEQNTQNSRDTAEESVIY